MSLKTLAIFIDCIVPNVKVAMEVGFRFSITPPERKKHFFALLFDARPNFIERGDSHCKEMSSKKKDLSHLMGKKNRDDEIATFPSKLGKSKGDIVTDIVMEKVSDVKCTNKP